MNTSKWAWQAPRRYLCHVIWRLPQRCRIRNIQKRNLISSWYHSRRSRKHLCSMKACWTEDKIIRIRTDLISRDSCDCWLCTICGWSSVWSRQSWARLQARPPPHESRARAGSGQRLKFMELGTSRLRVRRGDQFRISLTEHRARLDAAIRR